MNEQKILFQATWMDWGELALFLDPLVEKHWTVYFDGTIKASAKYAKSGQASVGDIVLPQGEFEALKELFDHGFLQSCAYHGAYDGEGWKMCLFDENGNAIHQTSGYIYGVEHLEKIAAMIERLPIGFNTHGSECTFQ